MITYTLNQYGLREKDMQYMQILFENMPAVEQVILYGSRARGSYELGSDVDLALIGAGILFSDVSDTHYKLENETPTLLGFDVLHLDTLKNEKLKDFITNRTPIIRRSKSLYRDAFSF